MLIAALQSHKLRLRHGGGLRSVERSIQGGEECLNSSRALSRLFANYKTRRASRTTDGKRNNGEHDLFKRVQKSVTSAKPDLKLLREILGL